MAFEERIFGIQCDEFTPINVALHVSLVSGKPYFSTQLSTWVITNDQSFSRGRHIMLTHTINEAAANQHNLLGRAATPNQHGHYGTLYVLSGPEKSS